MVPVLGFIALGQLDGGGFLAGIKHFATATPEKMNAWSAPNAMAPYIPWPLLFTGMFVNNMFYWSTNQSIIQRSLGAKNLAEAQKGAIRAGFFKCLDVFVIAIPGVIAYQLMQGGVLTVGSGAKFDGDAAYPMLVMHVMPKPLMGFFAAVMFGAILSSFNSVLNSSSTIFSLDILEADLGQGCRCKEGSKGWSGLWLNIWYSGHHHFPVYHVPRFRYHELHQPVLGSVLPCRSCAQYCSVC